MIKNLLFCFSLLACSPKPMDMIVNSPGPKELENIPVYIDKNFDASEKYNIKMGIDTWNFTLNKAITLSIVDTHYDMSLKVMKDIEKTNKGLVILKNNSLDPQASAQRSDVLAWIDTIGGHYIHIISDRVAFKKKNLSLIIMHEMGHSFGMVHIYKDNCLMNIDHNKESFCVDEDTVDQLLLLKPELNKKHLNYCK